MLDRLGRRINYLRISITDRCNLRCHYCMPEEGMPHLPHDEILSFEEILRVAEAGVELGIDKIKFTGGEPLVRRGVTDLVRMVAGLGGVRDLAMTTNGVLLEEYARSLREAGLQRVNVSLDALDEKRYSEISRGGDIRRVLAGIEAAAEAGLAPIKLNCVVKRSSDEAPAQEVARYAREHGYEVRFIRWMNLKTGEFWVVEGGSGGDCKRCNRLRLSSDGFIRPCLLSDLRFPVRALGPRVAIRRALEAKPECGVASKDTTFSRIGG